VPHTICCELFSMPNVSSEKVVNIVGARFVYKWDALSAVRLRYQQWMFRNKNIVMIVPPEAGKRC